MSFLADEALQNSFVEALNKNDAFRTQALAFDGSVLLEVDEDRVGQRSAVVHPVELAAERR